MLRLIREFWDVLSKNAFIRYSNVPPVPTTVMIGTTNLCNLRCFMCGTKSISGARGFMDLSLYRRIIDQCVEHGVKYIALHTVGEPLLHRDIIDQINYAKEKDLHVFFSTNGQLLSEDRIEKLLETDLDVIRFSVEGADKGTYESIRKGGRFETLLHNMKTLKDLRDRVKSNLKIFVTSIIMKTTATEIRKFQTIYRPLCDGIYYTYLANPGGQVSEVHDGLYVKNARPVSPCRLLWNTMVIEYDGRVSPCCLDFEGKLVVGEINQQSLKELWQGSLYETYREYHRRGKFDQMPLCGHCNKDVNSAASLLWLNIKAKLIPFLPRFL